MSEYFKNFGDSAPNSNLVHISVGTKEDLYRDYVYDNENISIVTRQRFLELWRTLFPYVLLRSFVVIMGKCETCQLIDQKRRGTSNPDILDALKKLHLMHRSGYFMCERMR